MSGELFKPTLEEEIAELDREIVIRKRCYPSWVKNGSMKAPVADRQLARMMAAAKRLRGLQKAEMRLVKLIDQAANQLHDGLKCDARETLDEARRLLRDVGLVPPAAD